MLVRGRWGGATSEPGSLEPWRDSLNAQDRPQRWYRSQFRSLIRSLRPQSVLDVGCGSGETLRELAAAGIAAWGVEPQRGLSPGAGASGVHIVAATAESLPFADRSFDLVVSEYSAHHFHDFEGYMREAERIARHAHLVLDAWYDTGLPSQRAAHDLDCWLKALDRAEGLVHHEVIGSGRFQSASARPARISVRTLLEIVPLDLERAQAEIRARLQSASLTAELREQGAALMAKLRENPPSDDGSIIFSAIY